MAKRTKADEKFNMTLKEARAKADWPCGKVSVLKRALGRLQAQTPAARRCGSHCRSVARLEERIAAKS